MITLQTNVLIDCQVDDVFAFVTDAQNALKWNSELVEMKKVSEDTPRVGTKYWMVHQLPIGRTESVHEVIEYELNKRFSLKITSEAPVSFFYRYSFTPVKQGTELALTAEVDMGNLGAMLAPIITAAVKKRMQTNFDTLKDLLETGRQ